MLTVIHREHHAMTEMDNASSNVGGWHRHVTGDVAGLAVSFRKAGLLLSVVAVPGSTPKSDGRLVVVFGSGLTLL
jgi:hypothetical protein